MTTAIDRIIDRLVKDEGEVLHVYPDHLGFWTLGVGRLVDGRKGGGISMEESRYLLTNDIRKWMAIAGQWDWFDDLDWARQGVLICMLHQLGAKGVAGFKSMLGAIARKDYEAAAEEMLYRSPPKPEWSDWRKQTPERCERMAQIMRSGAWPE